MSYHPLITLLGAEVGSRKRKNSNGVDSGNCSPPGYGQHVPQYQIPRIPDGSQNRGDSDVGAKEEQVEQPAVG